MPGYGDEEHCRLVLGARSLSRCTLPSAPKFCRLANPVGIARLRKHNRGWVFEILMTPVFYLLLRNISGNRATQDKHSLLRQYQVLQQQRLSRVE